MALTLYYFPLSPPSRAVLSFLELTGLPYKKKVIDILKGEQNSKQYLKINPSGVVPAIQDDKYSLTESEAIIKHLINTRDVGDEYYPSNPRIRAEIDRYMLFHYAFFRSKVNHYFLGTYPALMHSRMSHYQARPVVEEALQKFQEEFLKDKKYIAGDKFTIADLFAISELAMLYLATDFDFRNYPTVKLYIERCLEDPVINQVNQPLREFAEKMRQPVHASIQIHKKKRWFEFLRSEKEF